MDWQIILTMKSASARKYDRQVIKDKKLSPL